MPSLMMPPIPNGTFGSLPPMFNGSFPPMFPQTPALPPPVFQPPFTQVAPPPPPSFTLPPQQTLTQNLAQTNVYRAQPVPNVNQLPFCPPNFFQQFQQQQQPRPFCPPGCVPAPQKCPPGCVPSSSRVKNQSVNNPEFGRNSRLRQISPNERK